MKILQDIYLFRLPRKFALYLYANGGAPFFLILTAHACFMFQFRILKSVSESGNWDLSDPNFRRFRSTVGCL